MDKLLGKVSKPRVMLVGPWRAQGGVTTFMSNVADSPLAREYDILRFNTARPAKRNVSDNYGYGAIFRGGIGRLIVGGFLTALHIAIFPFALALRRPKVVQVQSSDFQTYWESAFYVLVCRLLGVPVLMRLGGAFDNFYSVSSPRARALIRRVLQWPDRLIVQSGYWRTLVSRLGRTNGVIELANCIPDKDLAPLRSKNRSIPVCLFSAGSEAKRKGIDEVIAAMRLLKASGPLVRFRILAATVSLRSAIERQGLSDMCDIEGYVTREHMLQAMQEADIFLLPSRAEGFPNSLLEAMASGAAAIVTPVGSVPEIVGGDCAAVVPVNDCRALADCITLLASDKQLRQRLATAGHDRVSSRYVQNMVMPILDAAWQSVLGRQPAPLELSTTPR